MKILALESSARAASAALWKDGALCAEFFQNMGYTHSRTLMPLAEHLLASCGVAPEAVDVYAVAAGPGSFTGIRIGIAAVKGMAWALNKPCAGVSSLLAMAYGHLHADKVVCAVMDARAGGVYNALFDTSSGEPVRLCADRATTIDALGREIILSKKSCLLVGDGAKVCYNTLLDMGADVALAEEDVLVQRAGSVCRAAARLAADGQLVKADALRPNYLRLPQAERERLKKLGEV